MPQPRLRALLGALAGAVAVLAVVVAAVALSGDRQGPPVDTGPAPASADSAALAPVAPAPTPDRPPPAAEPRALESAPAPPPQEDARPGNVPPPMIGGPHPLIGYGADALRRCAPPDGGPWRVEVVRVTEATLLYPDQNPPPGTLQDVISRGLPSSPDLVVVVFETGGLSAGNVPVRGLERRSCIVIAGHTAPETYWVTGGASFTGAPYRDIVYRGVGHIPDRRINGGAFGANVIPIQCVEDFHADQITVAFAENDMLSTASGCGRRVTIARSVCGPSAGGTAGRCGGLFGGPEEACGEQTWAYVLGFENMRRNPLVGCGTRAPIEVTNVVAFNTTDAGRIQVPGVSINFRSILSLGGPITGCEPDRAIVWFEQTGRRPSTSIYLEGVRSVPAPGCPWEAVEALWEGEHTVFHHSISRRPAPFEDHGTMRPHPGPGHPVEPIPLDRLEDVLLDNVGANFRLGCGGRLTHRPNALDRIAFRRVRERDFAPEPWENLVQYEAAYGRLEFPRGAACPDRNDNGIPDEAEAWLSGSATGIRDVGALNPATGRPWILDYLGGR